MQRKTVSAKAALLLQLPQHISSQKGGGNSRSLFSPPAYSPPPESQEALDRQAGPMLSNGSREEVPAELARTVCWSDFTQCLKEGSGVGAPNAKQPHSVRQLPRRVCGSSLRVPQGFAALSGGQLAGRLGSSRSSSSGL